MGFEARQKDMGKESFEEMEDARGDVSSSCIIFSWGRNVNVPLALQKYQSFWLLHAVDNTSSVAFLHTYIQSCIRFSLEQNHEKTDKDSSASKRFWWEVSLHSTTGAAEVPVVSKLYICINITVNILEGI